MSITYTIVAVTIWYAFIIGLSIALFRLHRLFSELVLRAHEQAQVIYMLARCINSDQAHIRQIGELVGLSIYPESVTAVKNPETMN